MNHTLFIVEEIAQGLAIRMGADMKNIDLASHQTQLFLKKQNLEALTFSICLGMREALTNAVRHGSINLPEGIISYRVQIIGQRIVLEIMDEGPGFNWRTSQKACPNAENGRGIQIMKNYFNTFRYNEKGNRLTLEKDIPGCF
ncbi:serine/threonine-protein kinase RsbW [Desulfobotulus alkaliphilus]|uniref:Serine/threonine-protein kinase RsbW n=1 Tax=Desulfobotulus alkaliphilus TaxID=622671 RepID=A0A562RV05_9BACT|nr:ATP-binding protein [Desulfobotulus alkaliphilus]TWI72464.1 serine/threonine-protein kinase RsbW [Desulfobotulus alkaliphilus]